MTRYFTALPLTLAALLAASVGHAQEQAAATTTSSTIRPIPTSDQMFRKTITRAIDLREKQNRPMFADGHEISRIIVDAVKRGELQPYKNDSVTSTFTAKEMSANMSYPIEAPASVGDDDWGGGGAKPAGSTKPATKAKVDDWGMPAKSAPVATTKRVPVMDPKTGKQLKKNGKYVFKTVPITSTAAAPPEPKTTDEYRVKDIYQMELTEEMIFDKKRSRMYHQIKTVSLKVPSTLSSNASGLEKPIATFKYSDLVRVFRANPQTAIWFNAENDAEHKNLADAFELWLFNSYIIKVSNAANEDLASTYGGEDKGILAAQQVASDLVEYEYNLWSY